MARKFFQHRLLTRKHANMTMSGQVTIPLYFYINPKVKQIGAVSRWNCEPYIQVYQ